MSRSVELQAASRRISAGSRTLQQAIGSLMKPVAGPPGNALAMVYERLLRPAGREAGQDANASEYTVDELAQAAGTTVRNVRAYQDRGLLPPPERRGRVGVYGDRHLSRLRLIGNLLQRGYSLNNIKELVTAWEKGSDLADLMGLEEAITSPWSSEVPVHLSPSELKQLFPGGLSEQSLQRATALDLIQPVRDGYRLKQPRLLNAGAELVRLGIPLNDMFDLLRGLRDNVERVADELVKPAARLIDRYDNKPPPRDELPGLADLIWQLRPMAMVAVESEVQRAMEAAANRFLIERVSRVFTQPQSGPVETVAPGTPSTTG